MKKSQPNTGSRGTRLNLRKPTNNTTSPRPPLVQRDLHQFLRHVPITPSLPTKPDVVVLNEPKGLVRVISGGQSGAQQAALVSAVNAGLQVGGTCPFNYMTIGGPEPMLRNKCQLSPLGFIPDLDMAYNICAQLNVEHSDATLVFRLGEELVVDETIGFCRRFSWEVLPTDLDLSDEPVYRPCLVITSIEAKDLGNNVANICTFVKTYNVQTLHITGNTNEDVAYCSRLNLKIESVLDQAFKFLQ